MNRSAKGDASVASRALRTNPQSCATMMVFFLFVSESESTPYWIRILIMACARCSSTLVALAFNVWLPPKLGRSMATRWADFCSSGELMMYRHTAQLSGYPWMKITRGLLDSSASLELGSSLLTKWILKPFAKVKKWWERPENCLDRFHRRSCAEFHQLALGV